MFVLTRECEETGEDVYISHGKREAHMLSLMSAYADTWGPRKMTLHCEGGIKRHFVLHKTDTPSVKYCYLELPF